MLVLSCVCAKPLQLCSTLCNPWTVAPQASLSTGFSRQEYWSVFPCLRGCIVLKIYLTLCYHFSPFSLFLIKKCF